MEYLTLFIVVFLAALTPGPDILLMIRTSISQGSKSAFWSMLGCLSGLLIYTILVVFGLSQIGDNAYFRIIVGNLGGLYLIYIAINCWNEHIDFNSYIDKKKAIKPWYSYYVSGFVMNISNPKVMLFYTVVVTPFISDLTGVVLAILILSGSMMAFTLVISMLSFVHQWFTPKRTLYINRVSALVFLGFAMSLFNVALDTIFAMFGLQL